MRLLCLTCFCGRPPDAASGDGRERAGGAPGNDASAVSKTSATVCPRHYPNYASRMGYIHVPFYHISPLPISQRAPALPRMNSQPENEDAGTRYDPLGIRQMETTTLRERILGESPCMMIAVAGDGSAVLYQNQLSLDYFGDLMATPTATNGAIGDEDEAGFAVLEGLFAAQGVETLQVR